MNVRELPQEEWLSGDADTPAYSHLQFAAQAARSLPSGADVRIGFIERMSMLAVCPSIAAIAMNAATHVFGVCNRLEMVRIHACSIAAQVVNFSTVRNRALPVLIGQSMRFLWVLTPTCIAELCVALLISACSPLPAASISGSDLFQEPLQSIRVHQ